jgi:hypothetical protein
VGVAGDLGLVPRTRALLKCIGLQLTFDFARKGFRRDNDRRVLKCMNEGPVPLIHVSTDLSSLREWSSHSLTF